jgi:hypothetical protein
MLAILRLIAAFIANLFKSRRRLEAENLFLRHQLDIGGKAAAAALATAGQRSRATGAADAVVAEPA